MLKINRKSAASQVISVPIVSPLRLLSLFILIDVPSLAGMDGVGYPTAAAMLPLIVHSIMESDLMKSITNSRSAPVIVMSITVQPIGHGWGQACQCPPFFQPTFSANTDGGGSEYDSYAGFVPSVVMLPMRVPAHQALALAGKGVDALGITSAWDFLRNVSFQQVPIPTPPCSSPPPISGLVIAVSPRAAWYASLPNLIKQFIPLAPRHLYPLSNAVGFCLTTNDTQMMRAEGTSCEIGTLRMSELLQLSLRNNHHSAHRLLLSCVAGPPVRAVDLREGHWGAGETDATPLVIAIDCAQLAGEMNSSSDVTLRVNRLAQYIERLVATAQTVTEVGLFDNVSLSGNTVSFTLLAVERALLHLCNDGRIRTKRHLSNLELASISSASRQIGLKQSDTDIKLMGFLGEKVLSQSEGLPTSIVLVSGDGDFVECVRYLDPFQSRVRLVGRGDSVSRGWSDIVRTFYDLNSGRDLRLEN